MTSIDDIIDDAKLPEDSLTICVRGDLVARYRELEAQLTHAPRQRVSLGDDAPAAVTIAEQMSELQEEMRRHEHTFTVRALGSEEWPDLRAKMPKKRDGDSESEHVRRLNAYRAKLLEACCVDPVVTVEKALVLFGRLAYGDVVALGDLAFNVNEGRTRVPFSSAASELLAQTTKS
jgi:hypothetical protein